MASNTFTLISSVTVGSGGASTVSFSSIPTTYTDLLIKISGRTNRSNSEVDLFNISINGNSSAVYSAKVLYGTGSSTASGTDTSQTTLTSTALANGNTATANTFGNTEVYIPNYTSSNAKSISADGVSENNGTTGFQWMAAGLFNSSSAITSLTFSPANSSLILQYSTFYLYGIKNS
jgi:aspartate/tyrosine/aromatic aminotransferase